MRKITITVSGLTNTGKSQVLYAVKSFLKSRGFKVNFRANTDFKTEKRFDEFIAKCNDDVLTALSNRIEIDVSEQLVSKKFLDDSQVVDTIVCSRIDKLDKLFGDVKIDLEQHLPTILTMLNKIGYSDESVWSAIGDVVGVDPLVLCSYYVNYLQKLK